ncbi:MAG: hypothetical protein HY347_03160 [candidate division NC10 bacterium]|nr:hypothetical protein [candidate division NC10 bacterium]
MGVLDWLAVVSLGATIFALIVGLFSAYNGRQTRSYIGELIRESANHTQELIQTMQGGTRELLERMDRRLEAQQAFLERMDQRLEAQRALLERQQALLERIADRQDDIFTAVRHPRP